MSISINNNLKIGILFLNLGGPKNKNEIKDFLYNLFSDKEVIRLPKYLSFTQNSLSYLISNLREKKVQNAYNLIGGGSPIYNYTYNQTKLVEKKLNSNILKKKYKCYFAMKYSNPLIEEVLENIYNDNINKLIIFPLYPQYSLTTTGSFYKELNKKIDPSKNIKIIYINNWYNNEKYVKLISELIYKKIKILKNKSNKIINIVYSAHGIPKSYINEGDPYKKEIEETVKLINKKLYLKKLKNIKYHLSYQSKVGPFKWLEPYTENKIKEIASNNEDNIIMVPISFVSDHIETLYEIDIEYKDLAKKNNINNFERIESLNLNKKFINVMVNIIKKYEK